MKEVKNMAGKIEPGCDRPKISRPQQKSVEEAPAAESLQPKEDMQMIKVGKEAPEFSAPAYHNGEFTNVSLSDFKGKWVVLCFYPGDFTFV